MYTRRNRMMIPEYFAEKNIFITGGTGFVGKALIEKFLRSCPDLKNIYVLIREKRGKSGRDRLNTITDNVLFDVLRKSNPKALNKLVAIEGDVSELKLGISQNDWKLLTENVNFIYHIAASVKFDDHLRHSIFNNVRSTREVIQLAYNTKDLLAFMHMSTTYCNADKMIVEEKVYPPHGDWQEAIRVAETVDPNVLDVLTQKYIAPMPNTYTYAKGLAESAVVDLCKGKIPAVIVRPSAVISTYDDPICGWNDNLNGPVGILVAIGKGILRTLYADPACKQDYIPVDVLTRTAIATTVERCKSSNLNEVNIYNCSKYKTWLINLEELANIGKRIIDDAPFKEVLWYPRVSLTSRWYNYYLQVLVFHMIPAFFLDFILMLAGKKPMLFAVQRKVFIANLTLHRFMSLSWVFINDNTAGVMDNLSPEDRENFGWEKFMSITDEEVYQWFRQASIGVASYLFKEKFDRELNRKLMKRRWILDVAVKTIFGLLFCCFMGPKIARLIDSYIQDNFLS